MGSNRDLDLLYELIYAGTPERLLYEEGYTEAEIEATRLVVVADARARPAGVRAGKNATPAR